MKKRVLIIGAGPGGLTAAMLLAHRGLEVVVLEQSDRVGGRSAELRFDGYSFDTGPTFLHQKFTLDEMFAEAGRDGDTLLDFVRLDPMTRLSWTDAALTTRPDPAAMAAEIERVFPGNAAGFRRFLSDHARKFRAIYPCLARPYHSLGAFLDPGLLRALPYVLTRDTVCDVLDRYFDDPRLKLAFTFQSKYLGMSPWLCPALFSILSYTEYRFGIYHVQGGLCRIPQVMAEVAAADGAEIRLGARVRRIEHAGSRMTGVELEGGERIRADAVVINADYAHAATRLLGDRSIPEEEMRRKRFSCSTLMLYLGLDREYPDEPHHHILFADDYRRNVDEIQGEREVSDDMSIYVRNSCVTDPGVAPSGRAGLYVLVPTINRRHGTDWDATVDAYRDRVLDRLERRTGMRDLRRHIVSERRITPGDWEAQSIFLGATFNLAHTLDQMLYLRPHNRLRGFGNGYLTGGGTHPGSGLPTIYESARISANLICEQFGIPYRTVSLAARYLEAA